MALKPDDPCGGFRHARVVAFVNEKMANHEKGPEFYLENMSLSWEEVEDKLKDIMEDEQMSSQAKEACTWGGLALGMRFACRQEQEQGHRVQSLHDSSKLRKSTAEALASDLTDLTAQQEMERKDVTFRLHMVQSNLAQAQRERDLLRWKLLHTVRLPTWEQQQATATVAGTGGVVEEEQEAGPAAGAAEGGGGEEEMDAQLMAAPTEAAQELDGGSLKLLGATEKNYTSRGQREGNLRSAETGMFSSSAIQEPQASTSVEPLPVQLPASFTYTYSCPLSSFSAGPSPSPPAERATLPPPPQMRPRSGGYDSSLWSGVGYQGIDPQEPQRDRRDSHPHHQRRPPIYRRPGDWDCPWCNAVNFSRREVCFRCGRAIWLQNP
uniref:RanBP2-type domain-containing protein n=1 Tax=Prolemur simus TaxID=1328070 RepID=A0A8C9DIZ5_PROSS